MAADDIIEKVRGLLRMAADPTSPHEAATALRHAKKLIQKHELEEYSFEEKAESEVHYQPIFDWTYNSPARAPVWLSSLSVAVSKLFDCEVAWSSRAVKAGTGYFVQVFGLTNDVKITVMTFRYILDQIDNLFKSYKGDGKLSRAQSLSWYTGAVGTVSSRLMEFKRELEMSRSSMGTALVVVKSSKIKEKFGDFRYQEKETSASAMSDMNAFLNGASKGSDVNLTNLIEN